MERFEEEKTQYEG
jgi:chromosome segregation ATPase